MDENNTSKQQNPFQLNLNEIRSSEESQSGSTAKQEFSGEQSAAAPQAVPQFNADAETQTHSEVAAMTSTQNVTAVENIATVENSATTENTAAVENTPIVENTFTVKNTAVAESDSTVKNVPIAQEQSFVKESLPIGETRVEETVKSSPRVSGKQTTIASDDEDAVSSQALFAKSIFLTAVLAAALVYSYWDTIKELIHIWSVIIDYHHGFFVVPFVVYFLLMRRNTMPKKQSRLDITLGITLGMAVLAAWAFLRYQIMVYSMTTLDSWTILLWVCAVTLICFGWRTFWWALPSLLFLAFMFPWPQSIEVMLRPKLQEFAAQLSTYMLQIVGEPAIRQVNIIIMSDNQKLDVAAACSGIRVLVSVIAAAYAAALLMRRPWWVNVLLFCIVIPVALFVNALRITITGLLIKYASGIVESFHFEKKTPVVCDDISGGIMLFLTFVIFIAVIWWIGKVFHKVETYQA